MMPAPVLVELKEEMPSKVIRCERFHSTKFAGGAGQFEVINATQPEPRDCTRQVCGAPALGRDVGKVPPRLGNARYPLSLTSLVMINSAPASSLAGSALYLFSSGFRHAMLPMSYQDRRGPSTSASAAAGAGHRTPAVSPLLKGLVSWQVWN